MKLVLLILIAMIFIFSGCVSIVSFADAKSKPEVQESYISELVKNTNPPEELKEVIFVNTPEEYELIKKQYEGLEQGEIGLMVTEINIDQNGNFTAKIFIFKNIFNDPIIKNEYDFVSSLKHEYEHIRIETDKQYIGPISRLEMAENLKGQTKETAEILLNLIEELIATGSEFQNQGISKKYSNMLIDNYMRYYTGLWSLEGKLNPTFLDSLKIKFFKEWMTKFFWTDKQIRLYLRHPVSGKTYLLPNELAKRYSSAATAKG